MQLELLWQKTAEPHTYDITYRDAILIGRRQDCDIVLRDKTVSRQHAQLLARQDGHHLHNLSATNAINVYSQFKIEPGHKIPLQSGLLVTLGMMTMLVKVLKTRNGARMLELVVDDKLHYVEEGQRAVLGRQKDCNIILAHYDISRRHAEIFSHNGRFYLRNTSEHSPTYVGTRQTLRLNESIKLDPGHIIQVGSTYIRAKPSVLEELLLEMDYKLH